MLLHWLQVVTLVDLGVRPHDDELYLIMELMDTDLHRIIQSQQALTDAHHKHFMYQLIRGVRFAHRHGVIHRDLKPSNLLVTKNCDLRVRKALRAATGQLAGPCLTIVCLRGLSTHRSQTLDCRGWPRKRMNS